MTLKELQEGYTDSEEFHSEVKETFVRNVNADYQLKSHRDWVEKNVFGFGERAFQWMWKLLVDEMPQSFSFLEVGVFRFQIVSLIKLLADREGKKVKRYCVTPLSPIGIGWESDYALDGEIIHDAFGLEKDYVIYKGLSTEPHIVEQSQHTAPYNLLFIDGSHEKIDVVQDFANYAPLVKSGGYLVIDDAACRTKQKWGEFQGISDVCEALEEWEQVQADFVFKFNVVHNMVYQRK